MKDLINDPRRNVLNPIFKVDKSDMTELIIRNAIHHIKGADIDQFLLL